MNTPQFRRPSESERERLLANTGGVVASVNSSKREHARLLHGALTNAFGSLGWQVFPEWSVDSLGDAGRGYIDIMMVGDKGDSVAIEVDRVLPRDKSLSNLRCVDALRVVVLRKRGNIAADAFVGVDAIMVAGVGRIYPGSVKPERIARAADADVCPIISKQAEGLLSLISKGHSYEQILRLNPSLTYQSIFAAAREVLSAVEPRKAPHSGRIAGATAHLTRPWRQKGKDPKGEVNTYGG